MRVGVRSVFSPSFKMETFSRGSGIEVHFPVDWYIKAPRCPHGPMLLFEKFAMGKPAQRRYYSCSACRDRKSCNAFIYEDDFERNLEKKDHIYGNKSSCKNELVQPQCRLYDLLKAKLSDLIFCETCQMIRMKKDFASSQFQCRHHRFKRKISQYDILHASRRLLCPLENDKKNAQYFLSQKSLSFIQHTLERLKFAKVICIGMPTLHEEIQAQRLQELEKGSENSAIMESILLDIDHRFIQFTNPDNFCLFNMFNHHFFDEYGESFRSFVSCADSDKSKLAIVLDPPFGGLVDAVAETLKWISDTILCNGNGVHLKEDKLISIFWIFPYFLEKKMVCACPNLRMLDYQVNYENHAKFKKTKTSNRISPVRIFTNIEPSEIVLPEKEGYRFCADCRRYVAQSNIHCVKCGLCPSKDGRTYVHCDKCGTCVKPGRRHCGVCEKCNIPGHTCLKPDEVSVGCHVCGKLTHKRRDCPTKSGQKRLLQDRVSPRTAEEAVSTTSRDNFLFHMKSSHFKRKKYSLC